MKTWKDRFLPSGIDKIYLGKSILPFAVAIFSFYLASIIFSDPGSWNKSLLYGILILMAFSCAYYVDRFLNIADPQFKSAEKYDKYWRYGPSILFSLTYGPAIFIKYYEYDDWVYLAYKFENFSLSYLTSPVNDHFVPLLKLILFVVGKASDPSYFGYALAFYLAGLLVVCAFTRIIRIHIGDSFASWLFVLSFSVWPSFETARTWFGGGFWLAVPVGAFLICLIAVKNIISERYVKSSWWVLAFSGFATVLSSSQVMIPAIFVGVYLSIIILCADPVHRSALFGKAWKILAVLILPSILMFYGRAGLPSNQIDFTGLWNGYYLRGIGSFFSVKVLLLPWWYMTWPYCTIIVGALTVFLGRQLYVRKATDVNVFPGASTSSLALFGCGLSMYLFFFLQVGLGRSWEVYAAINAYYVTFPLTAMALGLAGAGHMLLAHPRAVNRPIRFMCGIISLAIFIGAVLVSANKYYPANDDLLKVDAQKDFVGHFGEATCDLLQKTNQEKTVYLLQAKPYSACKDCESLLMGPKSFLEHISVLNNFTPVLAKTLAMRDCPDLAGRLTLDREKADLVSDGLGESERMRDFYKRYYYSTY